MKKKIVEGPLGLRLPEQTARYLDGLLKTLPKECHTVKRKTGQILPTEFVPGEKADVAWITTDDIDQDKEVILPGGLDLAEYRRNPIVLWNHDTGFPIGRAKWVKAVGNGIKAKTLYASRPDEYAGEWLPETIFTLVQQEILKGRSIGFVPLEMMPPTAEHTKARPEWSKASNLITKAVLFEYSVVSLPCNPAALVEAVNKGLRVETARQLGLDVPDLDAKAPAPPVARKPARKPFDAAKVLKAMTPERIERIAQEVYARLTQRGRV